MLKNKGATVEEMLCAGHGLTPPGNGLGSPTNGVAPVPCHNSKTSGALAPVKLVSIVGWI
jgi:hypothetical protein